MTRQCRLLSVGVVVAGVAWGLWLAGGELQAQGRGGGAWTTVGSDAQRTSVGQDGSEDLRRQPAEAGLPVPVEAQAGRQAAVADAAAPAAEHHRVQGLQGAGVRRRQRRQRLRDRLRPESHVLGAAPRDRIEDRGDGRVPGGLTAITKTTAAAPPVPGGRGRGAGGGGRGQGGPAIAGGRGGGDNVFAISSGGMVHVMNPQIGTDQMPPIKFLPPNAKVVGSILVDNVLYAATTGNCGGAANGVWAVDLLSDAKPVVSWDSQGAAIAGAVAPTFGTDSTIYVATGSSRSPVANAVVSLEPKTLTQKDWFAAARRVHVGAGRRPAQRQGPRRGGERGRPPLRARQRIAWRRGSQDAALEDLAVLERGRRHERACDLARCGGHAVGCRRVGRARARRHEVRDGERGGDQRRHRGLHARRAERRADAAAAVGLARSDVADHARRRQRRGLRVVERRGASGASARRRRCSTRSTARPASSCGRAARPSRRSCLVWDRRPATARSTS